MKTQHNENEKDNNIKQHKNRQQTQVLSERDFYPPPDDRCFSSGLGGFKGGSNFRSHAKDYYNYLEQFYDDCSF